MRRGKRCVAPHALRLHLAGRPQSMDSVAGCALRRFLPRQHQHAMLAAAILLLLRAVALSAKRRDFVGRGDAIRRDGACRVAMLEARAVAYVAAQALLKVRVRLEIRDLFGVARTAKLMHLLGGIEGSRNETQSRERKKV